MDLCNQIGTFLIQEKLGNNTFLVNILSKADIAPRDEDGYREIIRETSVDYGKEALKKTYTLKVNKNTSNYLTTYTEGMAYEWMFYQDENEVIYVPNPKAEAPVYPFS